MKLHQHEVRAVLHLKSHEWEWQHMKAMLAEVHVQSTRGSLEDNCCQGHIATALKLLKSKEHYGCLAVGSG